MRKMIVAVLIMIFATPLMAACHVVNHHVKEAFVAVNQVIAIPVFVPTYSIAYTPSVATSPVAPVAPASPQPSAPTTPPTRTPEDISEELNKLLKELEAAKKAKESMQQTPQYLEILTSRCAGCHEKAVANTKGKGTVLFGDGKMNLSSAQVCHVLAMISSDKMPPQKPLSAQEKKIIAEWVLTLK